MAELNEITSTDKLLDFIRKKADVIPPEKGGLSEISPSVPTPPKRDAKILRARRISSYVATTVGVDIGHEYLRLVKTKKGSDGKPDLVARKRVPIPSALGRGSAEFSNFLKSELNSFCGSDKKQQIWAVMSAALVEVHHIRIPQVPKKQIENVLYWTVKKESPFDEKENIFDFEVLGEVIEQGIPKLAVMYYTAPRREIEDINKLFSRSGWPLTGISITPFAVQNIFRTGWIAGYEGTAASLFIGNDFSRIDIYAHGNIVMTRGIKAGIGSMVESLIETAPDKTAEAAPKGNAPQMDKEMARKIIFSLSSDSPPLAEGDAGYGLKEQEIWEIILPPLERLVRQVERTFEYFTESLGNERVEKIYVSGAMNVYHPLAAYVGQQLGIESDIFDPLSQQLLCSDNGDTELGCVSERIAFAPALGMALSDNIYTPNFLFTYRDKEKKASVKKINLMIFIAFIVSISLGAGAFLYQFHAINDKTKTLLNLEQQLRQYNPLVNRDLIMKGVMDAQQDVKTAKAYMQKYVGMAVISDIASLTPANVRLINLRVKLGILPDKPKGNIKASTGAATPKPEAVQTKAKEEIKEVELEGFVFGDRKSLEAQLADYVVKLDNSPMFHQVTLQKKNEETSKKAAVLRFTVNMKVA
ncbi:MAG TPA: pilus assembly protein PilM [Syntrophales bacterium]|nr:pilus assembly protein PilM [Syntrophales bacterium]